MKILNEKVLIVIILFFSFLIFNNSNCEASQSDLTLNLSSLGLADYDSDCSIDLQTCIKDTGLTEEEIREMKYAVVYFTTGLGSFKYGHTYIILSSSPFFVYDNSFCSNNNILKLSRLSLSDGGSIYSYALESSKIDLDNNTFFTTRSLFNLSSIDKKGKIFSNDVVYLSYSYEGFFTGNFFAVIDIFYKKDYSPIIKTTPTLYIDDQNLKKRFKFQFEIPLEKEDTKYYVFLQKYTRNSYDSVTATFTIYTVDTPEGYDATDYENYMYYDLPSKGLYLPAGTVVKWYNCTINNGSLATLNLLNEFVPAREKAVIRDIDVVEAYLSSEYFSKAIEEKNDYLTLLVPTKINVEDFNPIEKIREFFFNTEFSTSTSSTKFKIPIGDLLEFLGFSNLRDFHYFKILSWFYYADPNYLFLPFDDLAFSNFSIVSYENSRISNSWTSPFYNIYRKTKVYDQENKIDDSTFVFNYSDGQDVSSLLPADMNKDYLTSPFFKDNENSTSKGNITYDINEIIQGDKIIDYSKEDNSIHNNFNGDYIENFKEGDNITINNYYTETIEKTSDSNLLHNIYVAILEIKQLLSSTNDKISNTTNNLTYNVSNTVTYLFVPTSLGVQTELEKLDNSAKEHLGIIYEPFDLLIYTVTLFTNLNDSTEIVLSAPAVSWKEHEIIPVTNFSFNQFFDQAPKFKEIHDIYLMSVDFIVIGLLLYLAYKKFKEVFNK